MPLRSKTRRGEPEPIDYINHRRAAPMPLSNSTLEVGRRAFGGFPTKLRQSCLVHRRRMKWILSLSLPLYALDQITKYWILRHVDPDSNLEIIRRWFYLVNVPNTGAAFGSFKNNNAFFIVLSLIAMVAVLSILLRKQGRSDAWRDLSLALLLAGVMRSSDQVSCSAFKSGKVSQALASAGRMRRKASCLPSLWAMVMTIASVTCFLELAVGPASISEGADGLAMEYEAKLPPKYMRPGSVDQKNLGTRQGEPNECSRLAAKLWSGYLA